MSPVQSTILCIDDEVEILKLRQQLLERHGFAVIVASSGAEGLKLLAENKPVDLVLLDYSMPEMAGDRVASELKRLYPKLPIVVVSGYPELPESFMATVDGYVSKGQDPDTLLRAVNAALSGR